MILEHITVEIIRPSTGLRHPIIRGSVPNFGASFPAEELTVVAGRTRDARGVVIPEPAHACSKLSEDLKGMVALVVRGECSFIEKVKVAQDAGAAAVIIYDHQASFSTLQLTMTGDGPLRSAVHIPSTFLSAADAAPLVNLVRTMPRDQPPLIRIRRSHEPVVLLDASLSKLGSKQAEYLMKQVHKVALQYAPKIVGPDGQQVTKNEIINGRPDRNNRIGAEIIVPQAPQQQQEQHETPIHEAPLAQCDGGECQRQP